MFPPELIGGSLIASVIVVIVLIALITVLRGIKVAKPDEAIIVTSRQKALKQGQLETENAGQRVVFGSRVFVKPIVEAHFKLRPLRSRRT